MRQAERAFAEGRLGRVNRRQRACLGLALVLALACVPAGRSQLPGGYHESQDSLHPYNPLRAGVDSPDNGDRMMATRQLRALNLERQKQMVADANKLLKLARELNDEITAANPGSLTPDQLHKIAEIEKLARSVKERMTFGVGQPALVAPPSVHINP